MDRLPAIPAAPKVLWSQFRARLLPIGTFLGLVALSIVLWTRVNTAPSLAGVAEGVRSLVSSPQPGLVTELKVRPFQLVNQGDPIAIVQPADPRIPLELLQAEMQLAQLRHEPSLAQQNAMDYQRVRLEFLRLKSELAVARVDLRRAENDLKRNLPLYRDKLLSEDLYDLSVQTRDALQAEVTEKERSVRDLEQRLEELRELGDPAVSTTDDRLQRLLARFQATHARAASNWGPITLLAPVSGMVLPVFRQAGETIQEGEPLVGIQSLWSDRVITYLRQPYPVDPELGMRVRVTTRTHSRDQFWLSITHIGAQVEVITNALAFVRQGTLVDVGLPIIMDLPAHSRIRPGELLDLWIDRSTSSTSSREPNERRF